MVKGISTMGANGGVPGPRGHWADANGRLEANHAQTGSRPWSLPGPLPHATEGISTIQDGEWEEEACDWCSRLGWGRS